MSISKKIIASLCATSTVLSVAFATTSAAQTSIVPISGADITCKLPKSYSSSLLVLVSSPEFSKGNTYRVSYGGTYTGGVIEHNICSGGTYSSGTIGASLTTSSSYITSMSGFNSGVGNRPF
jgi:hypothetical protein